MKNIIKHINVKYIPFFATVFFSNTGSADQSFRSNIFASECSLNSKGFNNCSFNKINLNDYSLKKKNEFDFTVSYEFKNCNFNYLNAGFYTYKNYHRITSGLNKVKLTGSSIHIKDPNVWDTKTNEYSRSCSFIIQGIQASLSSFTVNEIEGYLKLISEYKTLLQLGQNLETFFHSLNLLVNQMGSYNVSFQLKAIEDELKKGLNQYDDFLWKAQVEIILFEIEQFKSYNQFHNNDNYMELRSQITQIIKGLLLDIDSNRTNEIINSNKQEVLAILNELSSYPSYDHQQYMQYKNLLEK